MKKTTVHNLIIVDASGSMSSIYDQALAGINETIKTIKNVHNSNSDVNQYLTLLSFANGGEELQYVYKHENIENVSLVTKRDYQLRGCTALYDAIGESVSKLRKHVGGEDKALVTIITDGYENDSRIWSGVQVKQLIDELRNNGWVFTFIGANQDVEEEARKMGVVNSMKFEATIEGTIQMFEREGHYRQRWNERVSRGEKNLEEGYFMDEEGEMPSERITPDRIDYLAPNEIFVFGSNKEGHHNGGAARAALMRFGANYGQGMGIQGQSYAIPTTGSIHLMKRAIYEFLEYARQHPDKRFLVTAIGCGNAGYEPGYVACLFHDAVDVQNICLPRIFWKYIA